MDLKTYIKMRSERDKNEAHYRESCLVCRQPVAHCYCLSVEKFDPVIKFCILIHPIEARRRIASGRMSHLCLAGSELIAGHSFSKNARVNSLLTDSNFHSVILYPGAQSTNLSSLTGQQRLSFFPTNKKLCVFVVDGTWSTAKKMVRLSENLIQLPQICFTPPKPSHFRVRQQPKVECYSTLEAIHHTIELIGPSQGFELQNREHDKLLKVFDKMVEQQLVFVKRNIPRHTRDIKKKSAA